jgi:DNA-binding CsgD family transcriptional regulator
MLVIQVRHSERGWLRSLCHLFATGDAGGEPLGFMLVEGTLRTPGSARVAQLEQSLDRIAEEANAARTTGPSTLFDGSVDGSRCDLSMLTGRQREIVSRLMAGSRVPTIAAELFVSRSTVRNHLSAVYRMYDVHSQAQLIELLKAS